jgi:hypothetical protein
MQNENIGVRNDVEAPVKLVMEYSCDNRSRHPFLLMTLPKYKIIQCIALTPQHFTD